jgi:PAS domain S-box-containing protein
MRVLIADDSKTERLILSTRLRKWGYDVVLAPNGEEALKYMLAPDPPRLAILDWVMPGITGPEVARIVREKRQDQYIYMILVTALSTKDDIIKGLQAGADDYITKPVHSDELQVRLRSGSRLVQAWNELERSEKRTHAIIDSAGDAILIINHAGIIQYANPKATRLSGLDHDILLGMSFFDSLTADADKELLFQHVSDMMTAQPTNTTATPEDQLEVTLTRKDGETVTVLLSMTPLIFDGEPTISVFMADISEHRRLEVDLRHAQKMEAVGQLAAGIAHEINTPIQFISDSVTYLKESHGDAQTLLQQYKALIGALPQGTLSPTALQNLEDAEEDADLDFQREQVPRAFERILSGLDRVAEIVKAMKDFARKDASKMGAADINQAIESTLTVAMNEYRYSADIELDLNTLPTVHCNIGELNQVFLNLIVNAAHAIADVNEGTTDRGTIRIASEQLNESTVQISVKDTGGGIPKTAQKRVFEPFFTTKEVGRGSGQGLAISHAIVVEKHAGEISFETTKGEGTTFFIKLPITQAVTGQSAPAS